MSSFDLAIIGLGAVGSAALLAAARKGALVVGFDRFTPPHTFGSTHGETRVVREAIGEGEEYTPFATRSFAVWDQLHAETGEDFVNRCGALVLGGVLPHAMHVAKGFLETTIAAGRRYSIPHEILTAATVRSRFPAFKAFDGASAYFEPGAGFAYPERIVSAQIKRAQHLGAVTHFNAPALSLEKISHGLRITTATGVYEATRAILCVGAWAVDMLPPAWSRHLMVTRQTLHWYAVDRDAQHFSPSNMPVFIWNDVYGFPMTGTRNQGVKIATENLTARADLTTVARTINTSDIETLTPKARAVFPQIGVHQRGTVCLYTSTPDFNFLVDDHPEIEGVTIVSACSGHGFKHSAALGEAVAHASLNEPGLSFPTSWKFQRFSNTTSK